MATFIPFEHPSLTLGRVVDASILSLMGEIGAAQARTDAALDKMNSLIAMRRGLQNTVNELISLGVDIAELTERIAGLNDEIAKSARDYLTTRIANDNAIQASREKLAVVDVDDTLETPVDFSASEILRKPLASDSMRLDLQYFRYGDTSESAENTVSEIEEAIREMTAPLGSRSRELAKAASAQISQQRKSHNLTGTLVITATCTHRNVAMLVPMVLDPDRALTTWNHLYGEAEPIDPDDIEALGKLAVTARPGRDAHGIPLLSGVNYGSSFVGMVHTIDFEDLESSRSVDDIAGMEDKVRLGAWLNDIAGKFGMDSAVNQEIRSVLGMRRVSSHVNVIAMGAVPSFTSKALAGGVDKVLQSEGKRTAQQLNSLNNATANNRETVQTGSLRARVGSQLLSMQGQMADSMIHSLGKLDQASNKALDLNSMMIAFENYIEDIKAKDSAVGVPIGFQIRRITAPNVAQLLLDKYFPESSSKAAPKTAPAGGAPQPQRK